jgi:hypothetical protein
LEVQIFYGRERTIGYGKRKIAELCMKTVVQNSEINIDGCHFIAVSVIILLNVVKILVKQGGQIK